MLDGGFCRANTSPDSAAIASSTRTALRLTARRYLIGRSSLDWTPFLFIEVSQELRIAGGDFAIDAKADVGPAADPVAVMQVGVARIAIAHEGFVMAAAGTQRARPA